MNLETIITLCEIKRLGKNMRKSKYNKNNKNNDLHKCLNK